MRNLKKVVALVLAFALMLSTATVSFAATGYSDLENGKTLESVNLLTTLGVINGYPDGTFQPNGIVTRAEMAKLTIAALGYTKLATGTTSSFSDMWAAQWAQGFVALANGTGIVIGYPDNTFKPNAPVTYAEAATMIVRAIGYTDASLGGTWPNNYLAKAMDMKLFDDVEIAGTGARRGDIAIMMYNAIDQQIGKVNADNEWVANANNDTMIKRLGAKELAKDVITGEEDTVINLRPWVGVYASGYMNDEDEIILLNQEESVLVGEFDGIGTFEVDGKDYTVAAAAQTALISTSPAAIFFTNGVVVNRYTVETSDVEYMLAAKVSGSRITEVYAISQWVVTEADVFTTADADDISEDQKLFTREFELDDNDEIDMNSFELVGVASLDDIEKDNVVYVYVGGSYITKVAVGTETVAGTITRISSDNKTYTIAGKTYDISSEFVGVAQSTGTKVDVKLDAYGEIYEMEEAEDAAGTDYAVVLETGSGEPGLTGKDTLVKMFIADGSSKVFVVDGSSDDVAFMANDYAWLSTFIGTTPAATLVKYGVDSNGEVDYLQSDLVGDYNVAADISTRGYYKGYEISTNALIYVYDGNVESASQKADDDNYSVVSRSSILGTDNAKAQIILNDNNQIVAMLILESDTIVDGLYGVINEWANVDSDDYDFEVVMWVDGKAVTYGYKGTVAPSTLIASKVLYEIKTNANGVITELVNVAADADDDTSVYEIAATGTGFTVEGSQLKNDGVFVRTLDTDVIVYKVDGSKYTLGSTRDIRSFSTLRAYDVVDADGVVDVVVLY
ncbi:S-layer homology domain-containing protein [Anaerotalea alkaliphila]|uniref:S-layer homology domain-containing protein n=1 Tax=Anaerotalea alkaliphila TaxID=2662126 RepID=A0A7X5HTI5_9FIRM|nr:S-layer homology domain-containing protein [Anaerotalea alkaliphila]NDL66395.1 S-layer homology domain-containing protein [Anaerotalea alkaliphila]